MGVLDDLNASSLADAQQRERDLPLSQLRALLDQAPPALDPLPRFRAPGVQVIAEVKRSSPSKGALATIADSAALAADYAAGGAAAISVLTEPHRFGGSLADLDAVRAQVQIPVLRKDFLVSEYQLVEARVHGADLALLIVAGLDDASLARLYRVTLDLGLTPLIEVHTVDEALRAADLGAELIGVNNRNLQTLEVDLHQFEKIAPHLPDSAIKVAESGIFTPADVAHVAQHGAQVVLVGESLVRHADPTGAVQALLSATPC